MTSNRLVDELIENSRKKRDFLARIFELTESQALKIKEGDVEALVKVTAEKQKLIDQVDRLDEEFQGCYSKLKTLMDENGPDGSKRASLNGIGDLKQLVDEIMKIIGKTLELEKENSREAQRLLATLGSRVKNINQGIRATQAYNPSTPGSMPSYYIDKKK